jgi:hypothetical protein
MIRTLLGSTALLSAVMFSVQAANATTAKVSPTPTMATPQFKISGQTSFNSYFFNNKRLFKPGSDTDSSCSRQKYGRGQLFTVDSSRLKFAVEGKTDPGMDYGLVFVFDGNTDKDKIVREDYLFFGGSWGKILGGDTFGVEGTMAFGGYDQWGGTGFMDSGMIDRVVNVTTGAPRSIDLVGETGRTTKLTYLTPRYYGIQGGVSYTPNSEHKGEKTIEARRSTATPREPFTTDNIASGINFIHKFVSGFEMGLSATSVFAKSHSEFRGAPPRKNVASYAFGGTFSYVGVGFSVEYGNNGRSLTFKEGSPKSNAGQFIDFGLSYMWGATKFSTGYYYGERKTIGGTVKSQYYGLVSPFVRKKAKTNAVSAAIDHKLAPGLGVYFEYAHFHMKNPAATSDAARVNDVLSGCKQFVGSTKSNTANVFIVGSRVVF